MSVPQVEVKQSARNMGQTCSITSFEPVILSLSGCSSFLSLKFSSLQLNQLFPFSLKSAELYNVIGECRYILEIEHLIEK